MAFIIFLKSLYKAQSIDLKVFQSRNLSLSYHFLNNFSRRLSCIISLVISLGNVIYNTFSKGLISFECSNYQFVL